MAGWSAYCEAWWHLVQEELAIRATRSGEKELNRCQLKQDRLVAEAASRLLAKGDEALWIERALAEASVESAEHRFVLRVLGHRKQFPRRYLAALVYASTRHEQTRGSPILAAASAAYGVEAVLKALLKPAKEGRLTYSQMRFLLYYVRDPKWSTRKRDRVAEHDLVAELIRITSGGTVHRLKERPSSDE